VAPWAIYGGEEGLLGGVALFVAGSLLAAFSDSVGTLVAGRNNYGSRSGGQRTGTLSMIRHLYPERAIRSKALGIWAAVSGIALAFGPIIGGVIIGFYSWRGVFGFSAILGLIAFVAGSLYLPESSDPKGRKLDVGGLVAGGLAISGVVGALISGEESGYSGGWIVFLFAGALISAIASLLLN